MPALSIDGTFRRFFLKIKGHMALLTCVVFA